MTLIEVMVVIVILLGLAAVLAGGLRGVLGLENRSTVVKLTMLFQQLQEEAIMKNMTFRVAYDLKAGKITVDGAKGSAVIFNDPEARDRWEKERADRIKLMDEEELAEFRSHEQPFERAMARYDTTIELPAGLRIGGLYTPQYGRMMTVTDVEKLGAEREDPEGEPFLLYSYVFPSGLSEHTVLWLREGDDGDGWTIEVEPLSGNVKMLGELLTWEEAFSWVPDEGPALPQ